MELEYLLPQLTAITILWIITVISTRVCCSGSNIQLYSACPAKHVHVYQNGSVLADDDSSTPPEKQNQVLGLQRYY
uniref:CSON015309 protein n=1 Tax=Culicoides sonorensis TaxID=179676 RepID=A0A336LPI8_CULSO